MLSQYIAQKLSQAHYKLLEDGAYFGEISDLQGVWASAETLEKCRVELREVLEDWLVLKLHDRDAIPDFPIKELAKAGSKIMPLSEYA